MHKENIREILLRQREFFRSGKTRSLEFRIQQLKKLEASIRHHESFILDALKKDLNKPAFEAFSSEIGILYSEIKYMIKHLPQLLKPKKVKTPLAFFGGKSYILSEPLGVTLIISPWNYPFQLLISPLIGAIAAGNCSVLKPSELSPYTSAVTVKVIQEAFDDSYVSLIEGGVEVSTALLQEKFDYIFYTGGTSVGKIIMEAASKHLTPVTLELGGKSPCIVDKDIPLKTTARRITWGKFLNAGQTCIAPDYLLVHQDVFDPLLHEIQSCIQGFYGEDPSFSKDFGRIINERHFDRLEGLLKEGTIFAGGKTDRSQKYISPTLMTGVLPESKIMQDEIFGPILPVLPYQSLEEVISFVNRGPKPLALYLFSNQKEVQQAVMEKTSSGGVCINDTISHIVSKALPFGGVGDSGMGAYHGRASFDTFSHRKSVLRNPFFNDLKSKYPPYTLPLETMKKLMKFI